jgi:hypothetical protein
MARLARVLTAALAAALAAPAAAAPALLAQARYACLGYDLGSGFVAETDVRADVLPEEREALQRIRALLEQWGRYVVLVRPAQCDLLIAVRKGRLVGFGGGIRIGGSPGRGGGGPVGTGPGGGAHLSSPDDMMEVFDRGGSLIWRGMKPGGLSGTGPPLWDAFRAEVEKADERATKAAETR